MIVPTMRTIVGTTHPTIIALFLFLREDVLPPILSETAITSLEFIFSFTEFTFKEKSF